MQPRKGEREREPSLCCTSRHRRVALLSISLPPSLPPPSSVVATTILQPPSRRRLRLCCTSLHRVLSRIHTTPSVVAQTRSMIAKPANQKTRSANIVATPANSQTTTDNRCCARAMSTATNTLPRRECLHCGRG
ncbi:hypothetical protein DEO72_LG6g2018 [Vigna unguiculata]|uniref:Uncharacterized protein n=1 Tax=Vigna unguiculata TaxID=3917 RepID=A0A4D6MA85_VIGUN|nr:hypothetical protein DEO72_LG6g2018 [Vigna unguiculata]